MKHVVGVLGAVVLGLTAIVILMVFAGMGMGLLFWIIVGLASTAGVSLSEALYTKLSKKKQPENDEEAP